MLPALLNRRSLGTEVPTIDKYLIAILYKLGYHLCLMPITQIAKPTETDFEQSMLSIFDNKKATNLIQNL